MKIYRGDSDIEFLDVEVDDNTQHKHELLGEDLVTANFTLDFYYDIRLGDYIYWRNKKYTIFKQPSVDKSKTNEIRYQVEFGSDQYRFLNALYLFDGQNEFFLLGDLQKFVDLLQTNVNRLAGVDYYTIGSVPETATINLGFDNSNCLLVLQRLCSEFGVEFQFSNDGRTLDFVQKIGQETNLTFEFRQGLRNIKREKISDRDLVTRLYPFGGQRNITNDYGSKRLSISPLESNTEIFGFIEGVQVFDDIYPHREGTITAVTEEDIYLFTDTGLDFNINEQLIPGVTAKVIFNTGDLAGYELEVQSYNHDTNEIRVLPYSDENGFEVPNETFNPQVGDTYVLVDIIMPQSYIDAAEAELLEKATAYLEENDTPNVIYSIVPHYPYLRQNLIQLSIGDIVTVRDDDFGIDYETRILSITQSLANPYLYSIKVGDKVAVNYLTRVLSNQLELDNNITIEREDRTVQYNRIRRNLLNIDELRDSIFDPDGYLDPDNIKPLSIETSMISVGNRSQQFMVTELLIEANFNSNKNITRISDATLVHFTIDANGIKQWTLSGNTFNQSDDNDFYYIYARCVREGGTGDYLISTEQYSVASGDTYYYFLIGVLHSVVDDVRGISLTYGQTTINGKFITTGRIQSIDGVNFMDLDTGQFYVGDEENGLDWNVTNQNKLTLRGALLQTSAGEQIVLTNYKGPYQSNVVYYKGDVVSFEGASYIYINDVARSGINPSYENYWDVFVESKSSSSALVYRGEFSAGKAYNNNDLVRDVVKYQGNYYIYKGEDGQSNNWVSSNWQSFGGQFESVATSVIFAENATIADWIIKDGKISSQESFNNKPKAVLNGTEGTLQLRDGLTRFSGSGTKLNNVLATLLINKSLLQMDIAAAGGQPASQLILRPDHIALTGAYNGNSQPANDIYVGGPAIGAKFDITAVKNRIIAEDRLVAVFGRAVTNGTAPAYGGWFENLKVKGLEIEVRRITNSRALTANDYYIVCNNTSSINIILPENPEQGRQYIIKRQNNGGVTLQTGNNIQFFHDSPEGSSFGLGNIGRAYMLTFDGIYWDIIVTVD